MTHERLQTLLIETLHPAQAIQEAPPGMHENRNTPKKGCLERRGAALREDDCKQRAELRAAAEEDDVPTSRETRRSIKTCHRIFSASGVSCW